MSKNPVNDIAEQKVGKFTLVDGAIITASKVASEEFLARVPFVGNGSLRSGVIKCIGAVALSMATKNQYVQYVASGMLIDGVEDTIAYAKGMKVNGNSNSQSSEGLIL